MIKAFSLMVIGCFLLLVVPLCLGIAGGVFGLIFGIIGGMIGLFFGFIGWIFKSIGWIFNSMMHILFGWHSDFGIHTSHWHFNGYVLAAVIVFIIALSHRKTAN